MAGRFSATPRSAVGGLVERIYNLGEVWLGNRTGPLDHALAAAPPERRALLLARWQPRAAARLMLLSPLSANGRTVAIWLACLAGRPAAYWIWELVGLTVLALAGGHALRQSEQTACSMAPA